MRSSRCGEARPVRTVASSPRLDSTDFAILSLASASSSSVIATVRSSLGGGAVGYQRADRLAADDPIYVALVRHVEDVDGQVVVDAEAERGRVHHPQVLLDRFAVR